MQTGKILLNTIQSNEERLNFRLWLQRQFTERCKRNPRYSLRAFSKYLCIDPSSLSQILSGKRPLSKKNVQNICQKLLATPKDLQSFGLMTLEQVTDPNYIQLTQDNFAVISEWYHYAILELTYISGFKTDTKWISKKLSITTEEAKSAVERLKRLGLVLEENGTLVKSSKFLTNHSNANTSTAHKEFQKQVIEKALLAVDECSAEDKDITSMTMAIDISKLDKARELTRKYRREMCALLENGEQTQVYNLGIQLYPISKKQENL
ncbi:MAG: TIGR02147 family protein [Bdellovibrionaceae bacterium]|nr:TIGR02147 family protein [Pseudobdellovibrionaceae bacterium]